MYEQDSPNLEPNYNRPENSDRGRQDTSPLSVTDFVIMFLLASIPVVNLVVLFILAFGSDGNLNKRNFARAALLIDLAVLVLFILLFSLLMPFRQIVG
jgi:hypothetical protein